jgi:hypothetical protein
MSGKVGEKTYRSLVGKLKGRTQPERVMHGWEDNIKMCSEEI